MEMIRIFVLLSISTETFAAWNITNAIPGFIFEPINKVELIAGKWTFITNIDLSIYFSEIKYASDLVAQITNQCDALHNEEAINHFGDSNGICHGLVTELNDELSELIEQNKYFMHNRNKRGAINIVGYGMKFLFGTMDASDAEVIESRIHKFELKNLEIESNLKSQSTLLKSERRL